MNSIYEFTDYFNYERYQNLICISNLLYLTNHFNHSTYE
jgi:hypothetical protein